MSRSADAQQNRPIVVDPGDRLLSHATRASPGLENCNGVRPEPPAGLVLAPRRSIPPRALASDGKTSVSSPRPEMSRATNPLEMERYLHLYHP